MVEDEPLLRRAVGRLISSLGYSVVLAESGEEALEIARSHPGKIDLLLTDVIMSGISGPELAETFERLLPAAKVILMTGHSGETVAQFLTRENQRPLLRKPFDQRTLARVLRDALDAE
jgi:CheY-like chemotaxis protein